MKKVVDDRLGEVAIYVDSEHSIWIKRGKNKMYKYHMFFPRDYWPYETAFRLDYGFIEIITYFKYWSFGVSGEKIIFFDVLESKRIPRKKGASLGKDIIKCDNYLS